MSSLELRIAILRQPPFAIVTLDKGRAHQKHTLTCHTVPSASTLLVRFSSVMHGQEESEMSAKQSSAECCSLYFPDLAEIKTNTFGKSLSTALHSQHLVNPHPRRSRLPTAFTLHIQPSQDAIDTRSSSYLITTAQTSTFSLGTDT